MSELRAITDEDRVHIQGIIGSDACVCENGMIVDRFVSFDDMSAIVDYLKKQRKPQEFVGSEFDEDWLKVGDMVQAFTNKGAFYGRVNHVDSRDVLIVMDYQCSVPAPSIVKQLGNMQVGGDHYQTKIQPVEYIHANGLPFIEGNVIKYISRHKAKGGAGDIEKAISYCKMLLKLEYGYTDEQIGKLFEK